MGNVPPPEDYDGEPHRVTLRAQTMLTRIHANRFSPEAFNPYPVDRHWGGGRFDSTEDDPYPFLYAGEADETAVCESLLRDIPTEQAEWPRKVPTLQIKGRRISWIEPLLDLELVALLDAKDLGAVAQTTWLTQCHSPLEYAFTRRWAQWIRTQAQWAKGFVWKSRLEPSQRSYVFFGDDGRCDPSSTFVEMTNPSYPSPDGNALDRAPARDYLSTILTRYYATVDDPP